MDWRGSYGMTQGPIITIYGRVCFLFKYALVIYQFSSTPGSAGLGIRSLVFRANRLFLVSERVIRSEKRSIHAIFRSF